MDKLIVTATLDSQASYPNNKYCPKYTQIEEIIDQYVKCVEAGASIVHIHGVRTLERSMQEDFKQVPRADVNGWKRIMDGIIERSPVRPIIQFGSASTRIQERIELMKLGPEMVSVAFNSHDEHFQPDPSIEANEMYALHTRNELEYYAKAVNEHHGKLEIEVFQPGAIYNVNFIDKLGILPHPLYVTIFIGWPGGNWMPPTPESLLFMIKYMPKDANWNVSVMNPDHSWEILSLAISMGGHVRVGYEDNPFLERGKYATTCYQLVEKIIRIADELGREIATPNEARKIIWGSD